MKYKSLVLCALLATVGCASTQEVGQIRGDVTSVYGEFGSYREKTDSRLARIEKSNDDLRKQLADLSASLENRDETIKKILGHVDELDSQLKAYWDETKGHLRDLRRGSSVNGGDTAREAGESERPLRGSPEESYKEAFESFRKGRHKEALQGFSDFIKQHPDSPLAANARYWMGESAMSLKDYAKAIVYFQEFLDKYPNSDRAAKALLRQADAFGATGDKKTSTILLKRIVEVYPKSEEARLAERSLRSGPR
ncbi:MAG TPA: tol-pal system protein YbgF [Deltaproteobacteria bacterium]|nr:tol-pal system protein YbgF [Deltaproteobacteria bacterium]